MANYILQTEVNGFVFRTLAQSSDLPRKEDVIFPDDIAEFIVRKILFKPIMGHSKEVRTYANTVIIELSDPSLADEVVSKIRDKMPTWHEGIDS